jgi:hypothetical protein
MIRALPSNHPADFMKQPTTDGAASLCAQVWNTADLLRNGLWTPFARKILDAAERRRLLSALKPGPRHLWHDLRQFLDGLNPLSTIAWAFVKFDRGIPFAIVQNAVAKGNS